MARWADVAAEVPDLAELVRAAFASSPHATMATLRADGGPRISGTEVEFSADGELRLGSMAGAVKARDLLRDPRVAVHSPTVDPGEGDASWPGEAKVAGRAVHEGDADGAHLFRLDLAEVVWTGHTADRTALRILAWHPGRGLEEHVRT